MFPLKQSIDLGAAGKAVEDFDRLETPNLPQGLEDTPTWLL